MGMMALELEAGGRVCSQDEGRVLKKRGAEIRSDPQRRVLQSAEKELREGSPFTLALSLPFELSFLID